MAFKLAKEALCHYAREKHPELLERLSPYRPSFICAGYLEIQRSTSNGTLAPEIYSWLIDLHDLRNFIAHPAPESNLEDYDSYVLYAERLIEEMGGNGTSSRDS
jgi:hypothetical protein